MLTQSLLRLVVLKHLEFGSLIFFSFTMDVDFTGPVLKRFAWLYVLCWPSRNWTWSPCPMLPCHTQALVWFYQTRGVYLPRGACQLFLAGRILTLAFAFFLVLLLEFELLSVHIKIRVVLFSKKSLTIDTQVSLLFYRWKTEDSLSILPWVNFGKTLSFPAFLNVQHLLQAVVCSSKVFLWALQDHIIGLCDSLAVCEDVLNQDK